MSLVLVLSTPFVEMSGLLAESQKIYRIYGYILLAIIEAALIIIRGMQRSSRIFISPTSIFVIWCVLSLTWTQHLDLTAKRLLLLGLIYGGIFGGVCDLDARRSLGIIRIILASLLTLNIVAATAYPEVGVQAYQGHHLWRGMMAHKNIAGMVSAITFLFFVFDAGRIPLAARMVAMSASILFFVLAWSKTTLVSLPLALAAGSAILLVSRRYPDASKRLGRPAARSAIGLFGLVVIVLLIATVQQDFLLSLTDDTGKLTGRTAIWRPMIQFYLDHPFLGAGYGAYWNPSADPIAVAAGGSLAAIDQGHNGYLDLLTQVGLPGLALALYTAFAWPVGTILGMVNKAPQRAALVVALLVFVLVENFSESSLFADDAVGNGFLLLPLAYVQRFVLRRPEGTGRKDESEMISAARRRFNRQQRHHNG